MLEWLRILGSIVLVDLVLSSDNALVIGAAAVTINSSLRWIAFLVGGGGAILLRILLTYSVTKLLEIPYLDIAGGIVLLAVTFHLLISHDADSGTSEETTPTAERNRLRFLSRNRVIAAIVSIVAADATTSLDNIVAIAALAQDRVYLLVIGLLLSIVLLLIGSAIITGIIERLPWVILLAAMVLIITSIQLIFQEEMLQAWLRAFFPWLSIVISVVVCIVMIYPFWVWFRHHPRVFSKKKL